MLIAMMLYDGVSRDECDAFRSVLSLVTDAEFTTVAAASGRVGGIGGAQHASIDFDTFVAKPHPLEVIIVPGGAGCERAADDPAVRHFLGVMGERARLIAGSSTGSVILAGAGLLHGEPAATHWLASTLLERYGSAVDQRRMAIHRNVITCEGSISAVDAALAIVERIESPRAAERIRADILTAGEPLLRPPSPWDRVRAWAERLLARRHRSTAPGPPGATRPSSDTTPPPSVLLELVDDPELADRIRRNARLGR